MFFPYENMLIIKAKTDVIARSQVVSNMAQNSCFAALIIMIGLSFNSEDHDAFLKEWYSGFVLMGLIIMCTLISCVIVKCGFKIPRNSLIRFQHKKSGIEYLKE